MDNEIIEGIEAERDAALEDVERLVADLEYHRGKRRTEHAEWCADMEHLRTTVLEPQRKALEAERDAALGRVELLEFTKEANEGYIAKLEASRDAANQNMAAVARYVERLESLFGGAEVLARWVMATSSNPGRVASAIDWVTRHENVQSINMADESKEVGA